MQDRGGIGRTLVGGALGVAACVALVAGAASCGDDPGTPDGVATTAREPVLPGGTSHQDGVRLGAGIVTKGIGAACKDCHAEVVASYRSSAMHDSLTLPTGEGSPEAALVGRVFVDEPTGITIRFDARDGRYEQTVAYTDPTGVVRASHTFRVDLVVGSGHATRSYFEIRDGQFLQLPLTWYRELDSASLSPGPGYRIATSRIATRLCMGCHTGEVEPVDTDSDLGFRGTLSLGITCARCHGDGAEHALTGDPKSIVHPGKLGPDAQDQLCAQCHLSAGFEVDRGGRTLAQYRPGDDLADWVAVLRRAAEGPAAGSAIGGHAARLGLSACATATADRTDGTRLTCATCHNPHHGFKDDDAAASTNRGCFVCHQEDDCHAPAADRGARSCASCHMAVVPSEDIGHTRVTDHWIRTRPADEGGTGKGGPRNPGELALAGGALTNLLDPAGTHGLHHLFLAKGYVEGLEVAVAEWGRRADDWSRRAEAALDAHEAAHGRSAETDYLRGRVLALTGRPTEALPVLRELVVARPELPEAHAALGFALTDVGSVEAAITHLRHAQRLSAYDTSVAATLARNLHHLRRSAEALDVLEDVLSRMGPRTGLADLGVSIAAESGDLPRALRHAWTGLVLAPRDPERLAGAAFLAAKVPDVGPGVARALLEDALRHDPQHVRSLLDLTELLLESGDRDAASRTFERAKGLAPDNPRTRDLDRRIGR